MIMFCEDANYIKAIPLPSRKASHFVSAYKDGYDFFTSRGFKPSFLRLDNESSGALAALNTKLRITPEYVPPGNHRANRAERAIRTWKNHFISTLCTCDPSFPLAAWDELIPHAEMTLNLLRSSGRTPLISAWHELHGSPDNDRTPLFPPGMRVVIHEKPADRTSWAPHGVDGFYVGPAPLHYRCHSVITKDFLRRRVSDTLSWHPPTCLSLPGTSPCDDIVGILFDLRAALVRLEHSHPTLLYAPRRPQRHSVASLKPFDIATLATSNSLQHRRCRHRSCVYSEGAL